MGTISKVTSVQGAGTWESKHGLMYQFDYEFADGTALQANHQKAENAFSVGSEVEYEVTQTNKFGKKGKVKKPELGNEFAKKENQTFVPDNQQPNKNASVQKAIIYQNAFTQAGTFHNNVGFAGSSAKSSLDELCSTADYIAEHIIKKSGV